MSDYRLLAEGGVSRARDGACIPEDALNSEWRGFLKWQADGNTPDPVDPAYLATLASDAQNRADRAVVRADALVANLAGKTPAQIDNYIVNNVTDLGSAKTVLRALAQVCGVLARQL